MLMIRLARYGAKKKPFYHVVAIDKRRARNAICSEKLGFYNPVEKQANINLERVKYWISTGAQCSETAAELIHKYEKGAFQEIKKPAKPKAEAQKTKASTKSKAKTADTEKAPVEQPKAEKQESKEKATPKKSSTKEEVSAQSKTDQAEKAAPSKNEKVDTAKENIAPESTVKSDTTDKA
jgi:small subunit ribosomal protein S16